jgi:hypothetical protein
MRVALRFVLTASALLILFLAGFDAQRAEGYYYPPYHIPPGPPPNYEQVDTTYFLGAPVVPDPPPDSGGFYIWVDSSGCWNIASHLYVRGNNIEHYHGSILALMSSPPAPGVNIFATNFELFSEPDNSQCYRQNDRWGWYQWDENLYEIWWDVSTRETVPDEGDANDFMKITILGCAIDFNLWSSGHDHGFTPGDVYLGAAMTRLADVPGFSDTYEGISDPYQSQIDFGGRNITIFTEVSGSGQSYNLDGQINPGQSYPCGTIFGECYGDRFSGAFVYQGNGLQFSASCIYDPCEGNSAPSLQAPFAYDIFQCDLAEYCFDVNYSDDENNFHHFELLSGPGSIDSQTGQICFTPEDNTGDHSFVVIAIDSCGMADTADYSVTITYNSPPVTSSPLNLDMTVCDLSEICLPGFTASDPDGNLVTVTLIGGTLHGDTACFMPQPGPNSLKIVATDACGVADTSRTWVTVILNSPPIAYSPSDQSMFVCDLGQICLPGFTASDNDGNLESVVLIGGTLQGDTACFIPVGGPNTLRLVATDSCGATDTSETDITVTLNAPPVTLSPPDTTILAPDLSAICLPGFTASDPDGNLASIVVIGGALNGDTVCFTPVQGVNTLTFIATDACGAADTSTTHVTVNISISLAVVGGAPPEFTEEIPDSFYISITGGDPGSIVFNADFIDHAEAPSRYLASLDGSSIKVAATFDYLGEFSSAGSPFAYQVVASDGNSADTLDLSLIVHDNNRNPYISSIGDTTIYAGIALAFNVTGNDLDTDNTLSLAKTSGPGTLNSVPGLPPVIGNFSWTPAMGDIGSHQVIFAVDDARGGSASDTVNIEVIPTGIILSVIGGEPPVFTEEIRDTFFVSLGGYDPGSLSFSGDFPDHAGAPARYSISLVGSDISFAATFDYLGEFSNAYSPFAYRIIASDDYSSDTLDLSLVVNDNNRLPGISVGSNYTVIVDHPLSFLVSADDLDDDNILNLSKISGPGSFAGASGPPPVSDIFSWTPTDADLPGSPYTVKFAVDDGRGGVDTADVTITVYPEGAPTISLVYSPGTFYENQLDSVVFTAADPEGDALGGFGYRFLSPDSTFPGASFDVRNDTAYLLLTFDYVGEWSSSHSPFQLRLMGYSLISDADSAYLNIDLTVINVNRKPELIITGPHTIEAGNTVILDLSATDLDTDDNITISGADLPAGSTLTDFGDRTGEFTWPTSNADIGSYSFRFFANDNRGQTNSRDTVFWSLEVTQPDTGNGSDQTGFEIGCPGALPGSDVLVPVYLHTTDFFTGGYEVLIGWDPTALTLLDVLPSERTHFGVEYFNVHNDDSGPGTARIVWIADINDGVHTSPMDPGHDAIMWLNFHVAPGEFLFGVSVPIEFLVNHWSDNTISDSTGYILVWPLLTSGCVYIEDPETFEGEPNMNCFYYEIADAVLVAQRLIQGYIVWQQDDFMPNDPPCTRHFPGNDPIQESASDLNNNGFVDIADLVRFINIINGFIFPPKLDPATGSVNISMPDHIMPSAEIRISSAVNVAGVLVKIRYDGVTLGEPLAINGMDILTLVQDGLFTALVYSLAGEQIPSGNQILFTIPVSGNGTMSFAEVSASDMYGRLLDATGLVEAPLPMETSLSQNYPNPFNPTTSLRLALAEPADISLAIYDITGRMVRNLLSCRLQAGYHNIIWDSRNDAGEAVASGIYFARMTSTAYMNTIKMSLLR